MSWSGKKSFVGLWGKSKVFKSEKTPYENKNNRILRSKKFWLVT